MKEGQDGLKKTQTAVIGGKVTKKKAMNLKGRQTVAINMLDIDSMNLK